MAKKPVKKVLFTSHTANFHKFNRPFMRMLKDQGYTVHYASAGEEKVYDTDRHFDVPFERSPFKLGNIKAYFKLKKIIDHEKYDMIHTHTPMGSVVTRLAARDARKNGTRVIYTTHGFHFFKGAPLLNWIVYYPIEKFMARHTDTLITINDEDYERAKARFRTEVEYVPGVGVDESRFETPLTKKKRSDLRRSMGLKSDDFVMIYPAELSKRKRQLWLIQALAHLLKENPSIHLLLPGGDSLNGKCQKLTEESNITKQVHFLGYRNDIPELMMASDMAVSASSQEGLPVNLMEALAANLPIVASDCRGVADLVKNNTNGYLVGLQDAKGFSRKVLAIYKGKNLRAELSSEANGILNGFGLKDICLVMTTVYFPKEPIRILQVVTSMNRAGLETMLMNYYRYIDRTKVQFDFLVHRKAIGAYEDEIVKLGGRIHRFEPINLRSILRYRSRMKQFLAKHPEYKIVHSHLDALSALPLSGAKSASVPVRIAHSHNNNFDKSPDVFLRHFLKSFITLYATKLMACSGDAGKFMFGSGRDFEIVYNAIDLKSFEYNDSIRTSKRKEMGLEGRFVIGHVGRFAPQKNHNFLVDVFSEVSKHNSKARLVLVGEGSLIEEVRDKLNSHNLLDRVVVLPPTPDVHDIMQAFDVFVLPSVYEGLGIVAVEAQAAGLPVVASTGVSREVKLSENCNFIPLDVSKWVEYLEVISKSTPKRYTGVSEQKYSIDNAAEVLQGIYIGR